MLLQSAGEGCRRGEQAFLEELQYELGSAALHRISRELLARFCVFSEHRVNVALFRRVIDFERHDVPLREFPLSPIVHDFALEAAYYGRAKLLRRRLDSTGKPLVVEQLE